MTNNLREQRDLIDHIIGVAEERDAAYETRHENPGRWKEAKAAYAEQRHFWREVAAYKAAVDEANMTVVPGPADLGGEAISPFPGDAVNEEN